MNLQDKTIVVVGATGGLGQEIVKLIDSNGSRLVLLGRSEEKLKKLTSELSGQHEYFVVDFERKDSLNEVLSQVNLKYQSIDVLIHSAGIGNYKIFEETTEEDWNESFSVNVKATYFLTQSLLPLMKDNPASLVLTIGSGAGVIPMKERSLYCATKFALRGLMLSLAEEFKGFNPHFCLITLGSVLTEFGPLTLEEKKQEMESGKAYFTPKWVSEKLVEIIKNDNRDVEYTLYPTDYDLGYFKMP